MDEVTGSGIDRLGYVANDGFLGIQLAEPGLTGRFGGTRLTGMGRFLPVNQPSFYSLSVLAFGDFNECASH